MKPILVHCHIYYPEMWTELRECIKNISSFPFDMFVTMVEEHSDIISDIKATFPNAKIEIVENRGYDVGPFIHVLNKVNLDDYSYVVKLHTKRDIPPDKPIFRGLDGSKWREALLSFVKTQDTFNRYVELFENNPCIGMQSNHQVIVHNDFYDSLAQKCMKRWLMDNNFLVIKYAFVAGTMFMARANIFKDIQRLHLSLANFPEPIKEHTTQFAHVMERFFGYVVYKNNMVLRNGELSEKQEAKYHWSICNRMRFFNKIIRFFFQSKITKRNKRIVKICKIPFYIKSRG